MYESPQKQYFDAILTILTSLGRFLKRSAHNPHRGGVTRPSWGVARPSWGVARPSWGVARPSQNFSQFSCRFEFNISIDYRFEYNILIDFQYIFKFNSSILVQIRFFQFHGPAECAERLNEIYLKFTWVKPPPDCSWYLIGGTFRLTSHPTPNRG